MHRRRFLGSLASVGTAAALGPSFWWAVRADPVPAGDGPYGPLLPPDGNGIRLPEGFRSRVIATSGAPVGPSAHRWHRFPDGAATFATTDGGWVLVSNSEVYGAGGGAGAVRFDATGEPADAYRILDGTTGNCAGGPTPWGTWLSCEETEGGVVYECDPFAPGQGVARPALGRFVHEAVTVDPVAHRLYLSHDHPEGRLWRFTPTSWRDDGQGVLDAGSLETARVDGQGQVTWAAHDQPGATAFNGGEGIWWHAGVVYLATKGDRRVWALDTATDEIDVLYDATPIGPDRGAPVGVDNVVVAPAGDLLVAEDGGRMRIGLVGVEGAGPTVSPFLEIVGQQGSEITGPAFSPDGTRLYLSSQRGGPSGDGVTYEVTGPFRGATADLARPAGTATTTTAAATTSLASSPAPVESISSTTPTTTGAGASAPPTPPIDDGDGASPTGLFWALFLAAMGGGAVVAARRARRPPDRTDGGPSGPGDGA